MDSEVLLVNNRPYAIYDFDLRKENESFLKSFSLTYHKQIFKINQPFLNSDNQEEKRNAALAIRTAMFHGMETAITLLLAYMQSPSLAVAWIPLCSPTSLKSMIEKVSNPSENDMLNVFGIENFGWNDVAKCVFMTSVDTDELPYDYVGEYGKMWSFFASTMLDSRNKDEYNSLKHGIRVNAGSVAVYVGRSEQEEDMVLLGSSSVGSHFNVPEQLKGSQRSKAKDVHRKLTKVTILYEASELNHIMDLISNSINNIIHSMLVMNDSDTGEIKKTVPSELAYFKQYKGKAMPLRKQEFSPGITEDHVASALSKEELIRQYKNIHYNK